MVNKKAQGTIAMPFKTIFAIFLIVVFVAFAFMAVKGFLDVGKSSSVGMFYSELQEEVDNILKSQSAEINFSINLPSKITEICFANLSSTITAKGPSYEKIKDYDIYEANTFLLPLEYAQDMEWKLIKNIDIEKITSEKNPYCVSVKKDLKIKKDFYDKFVIIE